MLSLSSHAQGDPGQAQRHSTPRSIPPPPQTQATHEALLSPAMEKAGWFYWFLQQSIEIFLN